MKAHSQKYQAKREDILQAATRIINNSGLKGMLISDVAARLNLAPTSVAYYFKTKEKLAAACYMRAIETYMELISSAAALPTLEKRLSHLVQAFFHTMQRIEEGEAKPIVVFEDLRALGEGDVFKAYVSMFLALRNLLVPDSSPAPDKTRMNAQTHWVLMNFLFAPVWLQAYHPSNFGRAAVNFEGVLLNGIGKQRRKWAPHRLPVESLIAPAETQQREIFLRAATRLISLNGYRGASVENIVAELDVTRGAFYHHIDFKDDLIETCYARSCDTIRLAQEAAQQLTADSRARLEAIVANLVQRQFFGENQMLRIVFISVPEAMKRRIELMNRPNETHFLSLLSDGLADGSVRSVDVLIAANMLSCTLNACVELSLGNWLPSPLSDRATEHYLRPLFEGLLHCSAD
jgi:AcrR family transcriptional regulator